MLLVRLAELLWRDFCASMQKDLARLARYASYIASLKRLQMWVSGSWGARIQYLVPELPNGKTSGCSIMTV